MAGLVKIEKPEGLECGICKKTFVTKEILIAHKKVIHDIQIKLDI